MRFWHSPGLEICRIMRLKYQVSFNEEVLSFETDFAEDSPPNHAEYQMRILHDLALIW